MYARTSAPRVYGVAWFRPLDEPHFSTEFRTELQQTDLYARTSAPRVYGIAWLKPLDEPRFSTEFAAWLQHSDLFVHSPATLPPKIAGMAWWRRFDEPPFPPIAFAAQKQQTALYVPTSLPFVYGLSWWGLFDPPIYFKPKQEVERWPQYPWLYSPPPPDPAYTIVVPYNPRLLESPEELRTIAPDAVDRAATAPEDHRQIDIPTVPRSLEVP